MTALRDESPESEIARFLRQVKLLVLVLLGLWVVWLLGPILTPFVLGALLGWMGDPLADSLQRRGYSRNVAVGLVFGLMSLLLVLGLLVLVPLLERQVKTLFTSLPEYQEWLLSIAVPWIEQRTGLELMAWLDPARLIEWVRSHWQQAGGVATSLFGYLSRSGFAMVAWVANIVLLPILTFYFLRDWDLLVEKVAAMIPRDHIATVSQLARESNDVLAAFLRGQFVVMVALGAIYAIGLQIVGLKLGVLIGIIAGLISFIPYLGATTGVVLAVVAALVQSKGFDLQLLGLVGVVFVVGQLLESYVLTPRIVGDKIGLHPMAVIFAVMAGGQLFGFLGMLIALPVAAVANVLLRFATERYRSSELYTGEASEPDVAIVVDPQAQGLSLQQALQEQAAQRATPEPPAPGAGPV
jgi:predicted PurR-regulated permease PerM